MSVIRKSAALALALSGAALLACSEQTPLELPGVAVAAQVHGTNSPPASATLGWQALTRSLVAANNLGATAAARAYALVAVAQYGAINKRHEDEEDGQDGQGRGDFQRGAVAGASWVVLAFLFPSSAAALEQRVHDEAAAAGTPQFSQGVEDGKTMGNRLVDWGRVDRFTAPFTGTIPVTGTVPVSGMWTRAAGTPLPALVGPTLGGAAPYMLTSGSQFRPLPPPAFNSPPYLEALAEIRLLSDTRTPEQLAIARFWALPATTSGYWNQLASDLIEQNGLNERKATHVFAMMGAAMMDASIGCWDAKYYYLFVRPSQVDPAITLPIGLPNHPSYPSGHSCHSSAATTVLAHFFPEHAEELRRQMEEAGLSRMYAGIHYRFDIAAGQDSVHR